MQWVVAIIGVGASLQLISLVPAGIFIGLHQNIKWVLNQSTARILTLVALYIYSVNGAGILECAIILSLGSVIIVPFSFATLWLKDRDFNLSAITTKEKFKEIANYCTTMGFWNASVLLIGGISTTLVGIFDPKSVGSYALAVTAINVTNGVLLAILSPIGVNSAALMTEKDGSLQVKKILFKSTKILTRILISGIICYSLIGKIILTYWVGNDYAAEADSYLIILLFANCIRNMLLPLSMILLAIRDPKIGLKATIFEGVVVLLSSVLLGSKYGALGIAAATIFGAVAGAAFSAKYVMNELSDVVGSRLDFLINSIARPSLIFIPLIVLTVFLAFGHG
ncbi:MAG: hypothetical protein CFE44_02125 [Burkholderiales bacterium PBB4]|nr:MAG: hypothetical protein CFE44_02125 [Burkholderiales bacterium PBB4]